MQLSRKDQAEYYSILYYLLPRAHFKDFFDMKNPIWNGMLRLTYILCRIINKASRDGSGGRRGEGHQKPEVFSYER